MSDNDLVVFNSGLTIKYDRNWNISSITRYDIYVKNYLTPEIFSLDYKNIRTEILLVIKGELYNFMNDIQKDEFIKKRTTKRFNL